MYQDWVLTTMVFIVIGCLVGSVVIAIICSMNGLFKFYASREKLRDTVGDFAKKIDDDNKVRFKK